MNHGPVLVTGASGFVGSHLVEWLSQHRRPDEDGSVGNRAVVAWSRSSPPAAIAPLAVWRHLDLLDRGAVLDAVAQLRPTSIFHCAGSPYVAESWHDTAAAFSSNVMATHYLLDALHALRQPARLLIPGSATIYSSSPDPIDEAHPLSPTSPYALSKFAQEQLGMRAIVEDGLEIVLTRSFNHTGPRQTAAFVAPSMARQIAMIERGAVEPVIKVGNLEARRDFTDVRDVVRAYGLLMERGDRARVYNVASGTARPIRAVLEGLVARSRVPVRIENDPERLRPNDTPVLAGDASRLRAVSNWAPRISFEQMLDDLLSYWRQAMQEG